MIRDDFDADRAPGTVIGSVSTSGAPRGGVDAERTLAIDNGALRIGFLERPGWGREALAYGPLPRRAGRALSVLALNGHHASEVHVDPVYGRRARAWTALRSLLRPSTRPPKLDENFAVGWSRADPASGAPHGPLLSVRPVVGENGDLCGRVLGTAVPLLTRLRDVPLLYVVVLRERGAAYYAASLEGVPGLPAQPLMRPLAIEPGGSDDSLLATIHQSVIGESGWRIDSRVDAVRVDDVAELAEWYGSAQAADPLTGAGALTGRTAAVGGSWSEPAGDWQRTAAGARGSGPALLACPEPSGLLHLRIDGSGDGAGLVWRATPDGDGLAVRIEGGGARLTVRQAGGEQETARDDSIGTDRPMHLQVLDDGEEITVLANDRVAFGGPLPEGRMADGRCVGVLSNGVLVADFEAHPRTVALPAALDPGAPWDQRGTEPQIVDRFDGPAGELAAPWVKRLGSGAILLDGAGGARVDASRDRPNPGRTVYTRPWSQPGFSEIAVEHTPPGTRAGEGENGRVGLAFMQDRDNYLLVNVWVDDAYPGTSISSFLTLDGEEDHYRAVWCNIGRAVRWGVRSRLEIAFDGMRWTARVDGTPVLQRALSDVYPTAPRLRIAEVGIAVNWEWGDDTGSLVHEFSARGGPR